MKRGILVLIATAILLSGCAQTPAIEKPTARVDDINVEGVDYKVGKGLTLYLTVRVTVDNPNPVGAHLDKIVYDIYLVRGEEKYLGHGEKSNFDIRKQGLTAIEIPTTIEVDWSTAQEIISSLREYGHIVLKVSGSAYIDFKVTTFEIPFEEGKVVVFTIPESQVVDRTPVVERTPIVERTPLIERTPIIERTTTIVPTTPTTYYTPSEEELTERLQIIINPKPARVGEVVTIKVVKGDGTPVSGAYVGYIDAVRAAALGYAVTQLTGDIRLAIKVAMQYAERLEPTNTQGVTTATFDKASEYVIVAWKGVGTGGAESLLVKPKLSIRR